MQAHELVRTYGGLLKQYTRTVLRHTRRASSEYDDVLQELTLTLWRAMQSFDATRGVRDHLATCAVRNRATSMLRRYATIERHSPMVNAQYNGLTEWAGLVDDSLTSDPDALAQLSEAYAQVDATDRRMIKVLLGTGSNASEEVLCGLRARRCGLNHRSTDIAALAMVTGKSYACTRNKLVRLHTQMSS